MKTCITRNKVEKILTDAVVRGCFASDKRDKVEVLELNIASDNEGKDAGKEEWFEGMMVKCEDLIITFEKLEDLPSTFAEGLKDYVQGVIQYSDDPYQSTVPEALRILNDVEMEVMYQ